MKENIPPPSNDKKKRGRDKNQQQLPVFQKRRLTEKGAEKLKQAAIDFVANKALPLTTFESLINFGKVFFEEAGGDGFEIDSIASSRRSMKRKMEETRESKFKNFKSVALDLARAGEYILTFDFFSL